MFLYIASLLAALVISGLTLFLFLRSLKNNWRQKNKLPVSYLKPVLLMLVFVVFTAFQTIPRMLDLAYLAGRTMQIEEMTLVQEDVGRLRFIYKDNTYYYYSGSSDLVDNQTYRVSYTPYSRHVITLVKLTDSIPD